MKILTWENTYFEGYDKFVIMEKAEVGMLKKLFPGETVESKTLDGKEFYYWLNSKEKIITPLPVLAYAFGGMYNGYPPYGDTELDMELDLREYRFMLWKEKDAEN